MPRIHLQVSTLDLLNNDRRNFLETVDDERAIIEDTPDYLSEDTQGWILYLRWLCGIKLPQKPNKEFPSWRGTIGLSFCAESASHAHLLPRKECSRGCQGKSHAVKSAGSQERGASRYIDHPKPREEFRLPVSIGRVVRRAGSQTQEQERFYSSFWSNDLIEWKYHLPCLHPRRQLD